MLGLPAARCSKAELNNSFINFNKFVCVILWPQAEFGRFFFARSFGFVFDSWRIRVPAAHPSWCDGIEDTQLACWSSTDGEHSNGLIWTSHEILVFDSSGWDVPSFVRPPFEWKNLKSPFFWSFKRWFIVRRLRVTSSRCSVDAKYRVLLSVEIRNEPTGLETSNHNFNYSISVVCSVSFQFSCKTAETVRPLWTGVFVWAKKLIKVIFCATKKKVCIWAGFRGKKVIVEIR